MAHSSWRRDWVNSKCDIARALASGEAGGTYSEAAILTCATLSALAAEVWPGQRIDRVRFVELLVRLAPASRLTAVVSVPLLVQHLESTKDVSNADALKREYLNFSPTRIVTGSEVDRSAVELLAVCPTLDQKTLRNHSYACLIYEEVRSSYAHEYKPGAKTDSWPMTASTSEAASYVNRLESIGTSSTLKLIHFHIGWLTSLAVNLAESIDSRHSALPQRPSTWWLNGAP